MKHLLLFIPCLVLIACSSGCAPVAPTTAQVESAAVQAGTAYAQSKGVTVPASTNLTVSPSVLTTLPVPATNFAPYVGHFGTNGPPVSTNLAPVNP